MIEETQTDIVATHSDDAVEATHDNLELDVERRNRKC
jgi:hypothetical protein